MRTIEQQVLDCFPSGTYSLTGLLRLVEIVESDRVPSAAVECLAQPRMLVNPEFVRRHAETPEKLLMLVMHELHHVLLGHTRLFQTVTPRDNFVFDCVINAMISRMFPSAEHVRFLTDFYSDEKFPECLLRPPVDHDWRRRVPPAIEKLPEGRREHVGMLYSGLYSEAGVSYDEIRDALASALDDETVLGIPLIGGHGPEETPTTPSAVGTDDPESGGNGEQRAEIETAGPLSPILSELLAEITEEWPDSAKGRSWAELLKQTATHPRSHPGNRTILRRLLARLASRRSGGRIRMIASAPWSPPTPIPGKSRSAAVLCALGVQPVFYPGQAEHRRRIPVGDRVHVYVDVSGSMNGVINAVYGAVDDCRAWVHPVVHAFSNTVHDLSLRQIRSGEIQTTGGTDIECVAEHMATHRILRACIITDGCVGWPQGAHLETLRRVRFGVALVGEDATQDNLADLAERIVTLSAGGTGDLPGTPALQEQERR